jgi:16S rRNA (guanine(966)-N(2))-methyltransferase RsmD
MLRVIAGKFKGRKLKTVPGDTTRPVTDRVKESLFDIIAHDVVDSTWWDVFGGTGAIGIEALSRGANFVRFCDLNRLPIETIKDNLANCQCQQQAQVIRGDAFTMLAEKPNRQFTFIYIAPPQYLDMWKKGMEIVDNNPDWLNEDGDIIVQIHPIEYSNLELKHFEEYDQRKYGSTLLVFYQKREITPTE